MNQALRIPKNIGEQISQPCQAPTKEHPNGFHPEDLPPLKEQLQQWRDMVGLLALALTAWWGADSQQRGLRYETFDEFYEGAIRTASKLHDELYSAQADCPDALRYSPEQEKFVVVGGA